MKKLVKILPILMMVLVILTACTVVSATGTDIAGVSIDPKTDGTATTVGGIGNTVLGIIQVIGTVIAVGVLMVIGIKYMMGSAEEKAEYKKTMLPYLIGAVILFASVNIASYVVSLSNQITATGTAEDK